jgi:hypothetical protein
MNKDAIISELAEEILRLTARRKIRKSNLIEMVDKLKIRPIDPKRDLIKEYYEERAAKYGFKSVSRRKRNS